MKKYLFWKFRLMSLSTVMNKVLSPQRSASHCDPKSTGSWEHRVEDIIILRGAVQLV